MIKKTRTLPDQEAIRYLESFLEMIFVERDGAMNTVQAYKSDILDLLDFAHSEDLSIATLSCGNIMEYFNSVIVKDYTETTIARKMSVMKQFFAFLVVEEIRSDNPTQILSSPKLPKLLPRALSEENMRLIMNYAEQDKTIEGMRNIAMLEVLYSTGIRISELVTLQTDVVMRDSVDHSILPTFIIKGKGQKERIVFLNDKAIQGLEEYMKVRPRLIPTQAPHAKWLFPSISKKGKSTYITRQRFAQILKSIASCCGIDPSSVSPHKIRHSFASHMLRNGASIEVICQLLGHASISSTQRYIGVNSLQADASILCHPLAKRDLITKEHSSCSETNKSIVTLNN